MLNSRPDAAAPTVGLYFISGARKSYNIAKTLSLAGCKVVVRVEPSQAELLENPDDPNRIDQKYCALLYSDEGVEIIGHVAAAPPVDALLYEVCLAPPRYPSELRTWMRQAPRVAAWNSSWHEGTPKANFGSELRILLRFLEFLPHTQSVVMHNGRLFLRPTALFSRPLCQGGFVHPFFLSKPELRKEMFDTEWRPELPRRARLIFSGDAASPRRRLLVEQIRRFIEQHPNTCVVPTYEETLSGVPRPKADEKLILWIASFDVWKNHIPWDCWPAILRNCDFCFCPPGYEQKSHRVVESLLQGAIPILNCPEEYDIGMRDGVDCIIVRNGDWETAAARALDCEFSAIVRMREGVANLVERHLHHRGCAQRWTSFMGLDSALFDPHGSEAVAGTGARRPVA